MWPGAEPGPGARPWSGPGRGSGIRAARETQGSCMVRAGGGAVGQRVEADKESGRSAEEGGGQRGRTAGQRAGGEGRAAECRAKRPLGASALRGPIRGGMRPGARGGWRARRVAREPLRRVRAWPRGRAAGARAPGCVNLRRRPAQARGALLAAARSGQCRAAWPVPAQRGARLWSARRTARPGPGVIRKRRA